MKGEEGRIVSRVKFLNHAKFNGRGFEIAFQGRISLVKTSILSLLQVRNSSSRSWIGAYFFFLHGAVNYRLTSLRLLSRSISAQAAVWNEETVLNCLSFSERASNAHTRLRLSAYIQTRVRNYSFKHWKVKILPCICGIKTANFRRQFDFQV